MLNGLKNAIEAITPLLDKDILLIAGTGKSGTTWVQRMMNCHPEIFCPGEGKFMHMIGGGLGQGLDQYNNAVRVTNKVVYNDKGFYTPWNATDWQALIQFFIALSWSKTSGKDPATVRYIGDKDTEYHSVIATWRESILPDAKLIHVIRDGRDAAVSLMIHKARMNDAPVPTGQQLHDFISEYARDWGNIIRCYREAYQAHADQFHEVRYEDLLADPTGCMTAMFNFLGVANDPALVADVVEQNSFKRLSGGRERGSEDTSSFYRKGIAGDWRSHFDEECTRRFNQEAGALLETLGYAP